MRIETDRGMNVFTRALAALAGVSALRWCVSNPCDYCAPYENVVFGTNATTRSRRFHRGCDLLP
jgi:hypothetical protein